MAVSLAKYGQYRWLEMIPGLLVWVTLIASAVLSFVSPILAIIFIIVFDIYWMFRVLYFVFYLTTSWRKFKVASKEDWFGKLEKLDGWRDVYHVIFLPTYGEEAPLVRTTLKALRDAAYPADHMIVVLAGEGREESRFVPMAEQLKKEFKGSFLRLVSTVHPADLPGEIPGKGSNLNYSGEQVKKLLETEFADIPPEKIIATSFDVDTVAPIQYFAYLTYLYLTVPNPTRCSYQPLTLFSNNIWKAAGPVRVASFGTTFWLLTELARPDRLWTFSSHSMPWKMLLDVGFWQKNIVSEDSRIFLQGLIHYHGDYRVTPMYIGVSMDAVKEKRYIGSLVGLYKQQRRWAWGVENLMEMYAGFRGNKKIPRRIKLRYFWNQIEGMYTWATAPIVITLMGWLPLHVARQNPAAVVQTAPETLQFVMTLATAGIIVSGILSLTLLPSRPRTTKPFTWLVMILQWALLPVTFVIFGSFPSVDAQTRLMLGRYLGFNVTKKER